VIAVLSMLMKALIESPVLGTAVNAFIGQMFAMWFSYQSEQNALAILDAVSKTKKAKTQEERHAALKSWKDSLSRTRLNR
jgi:hypothetical protein